MEPACWDIKDTDSKGAGGEREGARLFLNSFLLLEEKEAVLKFRRKEEKATPDQKMNIHFFLFLVTRFVTDG